MLLLKNWCYFSEIISITLKTIPPRCRRTFVWYCEIDFVPEGQPFGRKRQRTKKSRRDDQDTV